jgi:hypothetical protein
MQRYGLQAPNLEADGRFQKIYEKLMEDWEEKNKEPYKECKEREKLSHKQKMEWIDWAVRKDEYRDRAFSEARVIFEKTYKEDFDNYEKYGIYDSLNDDPRFEKILGRNRRVQYELAAIKRPDNFLYPNEIAFVQSLDDFIILYPEVAEVYAIKDENVVRVLKIRKEKNQQHTQPQPDNKTQPNEQRKTGREDNQINTGADGDNNIRSAQDQEGTDANSSKEKTNDGQQETEIRELRKQIEALTQEIKGLREVLKELEAQAGKTVEDLKKNPQIAKLLESQSARATGNKPLESKQSNISKLLEILLLLLAAAGFIVGSEVKKA